MQLLLLSKSNYIVYLVRNSITLPCTLLQRIAKRVGLYRSLHRCIQQKYSLLTYFFVYFNFPSLTSQQKLNLFKLLKSYHI